MRVVGSLTTLPHRINNIDETIKSIYEQTYKLDAIYLTIPNDIEYNIPKHINKYCSIVRCKNYGFIIKILGALLNENDKDTIIITFDDDIIYSEDLVQKMINKSKNNPYTAIGCSGLKLGSFPFYISHTKNENNYNKRWYSFDVKQEGEEVDVLYGYSGVLYIRGFFPTLNNIEKDLLSYTKDEKLFNDDILLSGYLSLHNIDRKIFKMPSIRKNEINTSIFSYTLIKEIYKAVKLGMFSSTTNYSKTKTFTYPIIILLLFILILSLYFITKNL